MNNALLILGPTGSGKTPLGDYLEQHGLGDIRCRHFDFGEQLRQADAGFDYGLTPQELKVVHTVLTKAKLLEPDQFGIALKLLRHFCQDRCPMNAAIVMNGLPRHVQQAHAVENIVTVQHVIVLSCTADTVLERLALNSGGDRAQRRDDALALVRQKLITYRDRTEPLIAHYRTKGVSISEIAVSVRSQPEESVEAIKRTDPQGLKQLRTAQGR